MRSKSYLKCQISPYKQGAMFWLPDNSLPQRCRISAGHEQFLRAFATVGGNPTNPLAPCCGPVMRIFYCLFPECPPHSWDTPRSLQICTADERLFMFPD